MKTLFTIIFTLTLFQVFAPKISDLEKQNNLKQLKVQITNKKLYNQVIEYTKQSEGCILKPYKCPAGYWTIGYGHLIKKDENLWRNISQNEADSLLKIDFNKRLQKVNKNLSYNERLAIAHFIFNIGVGNYNKSKLKKLVDTNQPIDDLIVKYCHYKSNGKYIKSSNLLNARKFELHIYNFNYSTI